MFIFCYFSPDLTAISQPDDLDWEKAIALVADAIIKEQSANKLLQIRTQLYDIITKCIQPSIILKRLTFYLLERVPEPVKIKIIQQSAFHVSFVLWMEMNKILKIL